MGAIDAILIIDGVCWGLLLFTAAAGLSLAFGSGGVLNLTHGVQVALGAYLAAALNTGTWATFVLAVGAGTVAGAVTGGVLAAGVLPLAGRGHLQQAVLTLGAAMAGTHLLTVVFGPGTHTVTLPAAIGGTISVAGHVYPLYRLLLITVAVVVAVAGALVLRRTRPGRLVRATVDDRGMVAAIGVDPARVDAVMLTVAGGLAGLAGAVGAPVLTAGEGTAGSVLLLSLIVVVVGGVGSVPGALLAALGVGQVQSVAVVTLPELAPFLLSGALALALLVRPTRSLLPGTP